MPSAALPLPESPGALPPPIPRHLPLAAAPPPGPGHSFAPSFHPSRWCCTWAASPSRTYSCSRRRASRWAACCGTAVRASWRPGGPRQSSCWWWTMQPRRELERSCGGTMRWSYSRPPLPGASLTQACCACAACSQAAPGLAAAGCMLLRAVAGCLPHLAAQCTGPMLLRATHAAAAGAHVQCARRAPAAALFAGR